MQGCIYVTYVCVLGVSVCVYVCVCVGQCVENIRARKQNLNEQVDTLQLCQILNLTKINGSAHLRVTCHQTDLSATYELYTYV